MHSSSEKTKFTYNDANKVVDELFESLHSRYQENLETLSGSEFIFVQFKWFITNVIK